LTLVWYPSNTQTAKVVLQYNLSVVYALRGEYEKAGELLRQVKILYCFLCTDSCLPVNVHFLLQISALDSQVIGDRRAYTSCATGFVRRTAARYVIMMDNTKLIKLTVDCWCRSCRCGASHHQATLSTISLKKVGGVPSSHSSSCFIPLYFLIEKKCNHQ
jgi:hypothetical protein